MFWSGLQAACSYLRVGGACVWVFITEGSEVERSGMEWSDVGNEGKGKVLVGGWERLVTFCIATALKH